jgi:hypothetical protein
MAQIKIINLVFGFIFSIPTLLLIINLHHLSIVKKLIIIALSQCMMIVLLIIYGLIVNAYFLIKNILWNIKYSIFIINESIIIETDSLCNIFAKGQNIKLISGLGWIYINRNNEYFPIKKYLFKMNQEINTKIQEIAQHGDRPEPVSGHNQ